MHRVVYSVDKVIWDINNTVHKLIKLKFKYSDVPISWPHMVALLDGYKPSLQYKMVKWLPPPTGWWKCNTDGDSRGNPGTSSAAFCVRNSDGDLMVAKGLQVADTNLIAEAVAIREGLFYCWENNFSNVIIETDSMALVHIINGVWEVPWRVTMVINSINSLKEMLSVRVQRSLREGNTLADFFANLVFDLAGTFEFKTFQEIPSKGKTIINMDKHSVPNFRVRHSDHTRSTVQ